MNFFAICLNLLAFCNIATLKALDPKVQKLLDILSHAASLAKDVSDIHVDPNEIKYFLFTEKALNTNYTELTSSNYESLAGSQCQSIAILIHGWTQDVKCQWYKELTRAFLFELENMCVIQVDWSEPAHQPYFISAHNTEEVGNIIGEFVVNLHQNHSIPLSKFLMVGYSLGGHVAGFLGKTVQRLLNQTMPRIIALDAAGPRFNERPEEKRLNRNDAKVVEAVHTDITSFGYKEPCGTIDFYPNGGHMHSWCDYVVMKNLADVHRKILCNHQASWRLFIKAVWNPDEFMAQRCGSYKQFEDGECEDVYASMGDLDTEETGVFYLKTDKVDLSS